MSHNDKRNTFAQNLRERRKGMKLTQLDLALNIGVDERTVSQWETGKSYPNEKYIKRLSTEFGIPVMQIVDEIFHGGDKSPRDYASEWIKSQYQPFTAADACRALHFYASESTVLNVIRGASHPFAYQRRHNPKAASKTTFYRLYFPKHWTRERCAQWLWSNRRSRASVFMPEVNNGR